MHTIIPVSVLRAESPVRFSATTAEVEELSMNLGVDLFAYADDLTGESAEEKAGRLAAARDMLADDLDLHVRTVRAAADSAHVADVEAVVLDLPALASQLWLAGRRGAEAAA